MNKLSLIFFVTIGLAACSPKLTPDHTWAGARWMLTEMNGVPVQVSGTDKDAHIEFLPAEKTFVGTGGCNRIRGAYKLAGKELSFSAPAASRMACPDSKFEDKFLELLATVNRWTVNNNEMKLLNKDAEVMKLQRISTQ